jgi:hypothetical protein
LLLRWRPSSFAVRRGIPRRCSTAPCCGSARSGSPTA